MVLGGLVMRPLHDGGNGLLERPLMNWTWYTFNATDPADAMEDPDLDGDWECTNAGCTYTAYNNFQEFYGITNASLVSPTLVRSTPIPIAGTSPPINVVVSEWWELRETLLGLKQPNSYQVNYMRMYRTNSTDELYALVLNDMDTDYMNIDNANDIHLVKGDWTDEYGRVFGDQYHFPNTGIGENVWGWWRIDMDGDQIADGTDPLNWDSDGDWLNDWFEIENDMLDNIRGNGPSPLRWDDRKTNIG